MRFEHLIEINAASGDVASLIPPFSRAQLWRALMARVYEPQSLPLGPDACDWVEEGVESPPTVERVRRHLRFGSLELSDRVWLEPMQRIVFTPDERPGEPAVVLTLTVEEPPSGGLWLRFVYESTHEPSAEQAYYDEFRHSAWLANDRDMVRAFRVWLDQGRLSPPGLH